jgi:hypothetical protein
VIIIRDMAVEWWESKRPVEWDLKEHLKHPRVNCNTKAEQNLATAIAADLK